MNIALVLRKKCLHQLKLSHESFFFEVIGFLVFLVKTVNDNKIHLQDPFTINYIKRERNKILNSSDELQVSNWLTFNRSKVGDRIWF